MGLPNIAFWSPPRLRFILRQPSSPPASVRRVGRGSLPAAARRLRASARYWRRYFRVDAYTIIISLDDGGRHDNDILLAQYELAV